MKTVFFAARKIHRDYFSKLSALLPDSSVIYYKSCLIPAFTGLPVRNLKAVVCQHINEKKNHPKHRQKGAGYWQLFGLLKLIESCWLYLTYYRALKQSGADQVVIWNGLKYRQMVALEAAIQLGLQPVFMENGLLPGYTTLDFKGVNYINSVPRDPDFFRNYTSGTDSGYSADIKTEAAENQISKLPENYIFVPFQVNTDSQVTRFSPWIRDMFELVRTIDSVTASLGDNSPFFIFKPHPACPEDYTGLIAEFQNHPRISFQTGSAFSTPQLIANADAVITINSTVGIESLLLRKKVIVLGQAFYNMAGLTLAADSFESLCQVITDLPTWETDIQLREKFFSYLANEYQVPGRWQDSAQEHLKQVSDRIKAGP